MIEKAKQLAKGELRYVARPSTAGGPRSKKTVWNVYDRVLGSWPVRRPKPVGQVQQDMTEEDAQAEAARLEAARDEG